MTDEIYKPQNYQPGYKPPAQPERPENATPGPSNAPRRVYDVSRGVAFFWDGEGWCTNGFALWRSELLDMPPVPSAGWWMPKAKSVEASALGKSSVDVERLIRDNALKDASLIPMTWEGVTYRCSSPLNDPEPHVLDRWSPVEGKIENVFVYTDAKFRPLLMHDNNRMKPNTVWLSVSNKTPDQTNSRPMVVKNPDDEVVSMVMGIRTNNDYVAHL